MCERTAYLPTSDGQVTYFCSSSAPVGWWESDNDAAGTLPLELDNHAKVCILIGHFKGRTKRRRTFYLTIFSIKNFLLNIKMTNLSLVQHYNNKLLQFN